MVKWYAACEQLVHPRNPTTPDEVNFAWIYQDMQINQILAERRKYLKVEFNPPRGNVLLLFETYLLAGNSNR